MSHITGGGFLENVGRVLPKGRGCYIDASTWPLPPVFKFLMQKGNVEPQEMARTFNNGIGMILIVAPETLEPMLEILKQGDARVYRIGEVTNKPGVDVRNLDTWV